MRCPVDNEVTDRIIEQVLRGQTEAFEEVIRLHQKEVWKIAASALHEREAVADLVQEVFVSAYANLRRYQLGRDFGVWVRSIARNLVRERLRDRSRETRHTRYYRDVLVRRYEDSEAAEGHQARLAEAHGNCRGRLPEPSARLLELRYERSMSHQEMAALRGRSVSAVKQLMYRVHLMLRDCIQKRMMEA